MIVTEPAAFLAAFDDERFPPRMPATARAAFLVAPADFSLAAESARDNRYMDMAARPDPLRALAEHATLARRIGADLPTVCFPGDPDCPDGLFPNNVFATAPGRLIVGRMRHAVRRREAERGDIRAFFADTLGYRTIDLSHEAFVAELTGSLVIDRARGIGYCGLSERCDADGARAMHEAFGLRLTFCFALAAGEYHTNVVLALLGGRTAMLAPDGFADPAVPAAIARAYGDRAVWLTPGQKRAYAGNAISLGAERVWISARGADALSPDQHAALQRWGWTIGSVDLETIETAGGSLRCCVAEIY
ncbi:MAG TPA: arginine deiminase-related protein [Dokdonella sp.]|uniref:arginine deiminase-related protein n=1 Tax=Dokdonella sp. TaxID=2291710 RepID=UPI002CB70432|nr:arginine deiminase-related protein [Dokdonella sp.]HUD41332.1 arginine deiminase-related protein [Dokdonella sp.]